MINRITMTASFLMAIAIGLGAFGAHALKNSVSALALETYQTGVTYHLIHAIALLVIGVLEQVKPNMNLKAIKHGFLGGILLFSFNCYFYAITSQKAFAMAVPLGGTLFLITWLKLAWELRSLKHQAD